jgi:3-hydroxybutyryl-CoA dehydrogenase
MGPCELMDLIGHDTNFAVTQSVYDANFGDKRYQPSLVPARDGRRRLLGRKSGRGFFSHGAGAAQAAGRAPFARRGARPGRSSRCMAAASPSSAGRRASRPPT